MRKVESNSKFGGLVSMGKLYLFFFQLLIISSSLMFVLSASAQQLTSRPDRGYGGQGGYQTSNIDSISLQNGGVNVEIPLASLPPIAGGKLSYTLTASYNSKLWDAHRSEAQGTTSTPGCQPTYSTQDVWQAEGGAGWHIGSQYQIFFRDAHDDYDYLPASSEQCYGYEFYFMQGRFFKPMIRMPDGSEHELRIYGYWETYSWQGTREHLKNYYKQIGGYPNYPTFSSPVRMYTIDGSYITVIINPTSSTFYTTTIYLKDGTKIETTEQGQRTIDPNGNSILMSGRSVNGSYEQFVRDEQTGREIKWSGMTYNNQPATKVEYQTVGGTWQNTIVVWGTTTVQGKLYSKTGWNPDQGGENLSECGLDVQLPDTPFNVIREIIFPATEQGIAPQKYTFGYNSDATVQTTTANPRWVCSYWQTFPPFTRTASVGWGELSDVITPTGAHIKYNYRNDGTHDFVGSGGFVDDLVDEILRNNITSKVITHDSTTDTWTYNISSYGSNFVTGGSVTNPDGSWHSELYNPTNIAYAGAGSSDGSGGRLVKSSESGKILTERKWMALGGLTPTIGGIQWVAVNSVIDTEYTTLLADDGVTRLKISAKKFQYDYNGELTQTIEYDWFDPNTVTYSNPGNYLSMPAGVPSSATVLKVTNTSYYNQAVNSNSNYAYHKRNLGGTSTVILGALQQSSIGDGAINQSINQFSYDGQPYGTAPTKGNATQISRWNDTNNQWINSTSTYDSYGNVITTTDPNGNVTQIFYEDNTHAMPTKKIIDPQNGTGQQISTTTYDFATGLPTSSTDANGNVTSIDYTNHLLGAVDPFGRPGTTYSPYVNVGGVNKRQTVKTFYEDAARKTRAESDLFNEGDALLKSRETRDQIGRVILTEKNENGSNSYTISSQTVYKTQDRVVLTSNPSRGTASPTDGWKRLTNDILGREIELATFSGAAQPPVSSTNANWTGSVTTSYSVNTRTVTDQVGNKRRSFTNALGQLTRVDEPNDAGQLDINGNPVQPIAYEYDTLGNLKKVIQGAQTRIFVYDSLSRLKQATHPEMGTTPTNGTSSYQYDNNGNLTQKTDPRGVVTTYTYDGFNRVKTRTYSNEPGGQTPTPVVTYYYDGIYLNAQNTQQTATGGVKGKLTSVSSSLSRTNYTAFDALGRVTQSQQITDGAAYNPMTYAYSLNGTLIEQIYPSGRIVKNTLDNEGNLAQVESAKTQNGSLKVYASNFTYTATGAVSSVRLGNGRWESLQFNSRLQPTQIALGTSQGLTNRLKLDYTYGTAGQNNGNVQSQTITVSSVGINTGFTAVQNYTYDSLNRIKNATETVSGAQTWKQTFIYDRFGNRTFDEANTTTLPKNCNNNTEVCAADRKIFNPSISPNSNRIDSDQDGDNQNDYLFDAAGNVTKDANLRTFAYDAENKQTEVKDSSLQIVGRYYYDGDGKRIKKYVPSTQETTIFIYDASGKLIAEYSTVAASAAQAKVSYLTNDHLGSPRIITDAGGMVTARHDYRPFGEEIQRNNYGGDDIRKKFTGYERDGETMLDFAQARYHSFNLGRFNSPDPITIKKERLPDPQTINLYVYARNNPLKYIDPNGEEFKGTDGKKVDIEMVNGELVIKSKNASKDLTRLVNLINKSGSATALKQFNRLNAHKTMINFAFGNKDPQKSAFARHQPHGTRSDGSKGALTFDSVTGKFDGKADIVKDSGGNEVYAEATITIFEGEYKGSTQDVEDSMVATFGHEAEHDLDLKQVQETKNQTYRDSVYHARTPDGRNWAVGSPYWVGDQIRAEIKDFRTRSSKPQCPTGHMCF